MIGVRLLSAYKLGVFLSLHSGIFHSPERLFHTQNEEVRQKLDGFKRLTGHFRKGNGQYAYLFGKITLLLYRPTQRR